MLPTKRNFIDILESTGVKTGTLQKLHKPGSPLDYAFNTVVTDIEEGNDIEHSFHVFRNCKSLIKFCSTSLHVTDILILFYAALLHDISKTKNTAINQEIKQILDKSCPLYADSHADHAVRSAYYLLNKYQENNLRFPGLNRRQVQECISVVAFHSSGRLHKPFINLNVENKQIFLCLLFRLADISDGESTRVQASSTVKKKLHPRKTKIRSQVTKVSINRHRVKWSIKKLSPETRYAVETDNLLLAKHGLLLEALCLPSRITYNSGVISLPPEVKANHVTLENFGLLSHGSSVSPLVISAATLPDLYEQIVAAFCGIDVQGSFPQANNYFGPIVLEVRDIAHDQAVHTHIRSTVGRSMDMVSGYTERWLQTSSKASEEFYFGYTHGQRIWRYLYPKEQDDIDTDFKEWSGEINQFNNCVEILARGTKDARQAYVVIPHPLVDNPKSSYYKSQEFSPSLIAIHFRIESENALSGFAMLRSQELSLFSIINYLEIKSLIFKLIAELAKRKRKLRPGRAVMMSSLAYFDPGTPLLEKPTICKKKPAQIRNFARHLAEPSIRHEFFDMLQEFAELNYQRIETGWCDCLAQGFDGGTISKSTACRMKRAVATLKEKLNKVEMRSAKKLIMRREVLVQKLRLIGIFKGKIEAALR